MRNIDLDSLNLESGAHTSPEAGMCVMEAVAYVNGDKHSDSPECADPVLGTFMRSINDKMSDVDRQMLKPYIMKLIGTNQGADKSLKRSKILAYASLTIFAAEALSRAGLELEKEAGNLKSIKFPETSAQWNAARDAANAASNAANAASYAAYAASNAAYAARSAARYAASDAASYAASTDFWKSVLKVLDEVIAA